MGYTAFKKIALLMVPAIFGVSDQLIYCSILCWRLFTTGSVSWLYYSDRSVNCRWAFLNCYCHSYFTQSVSTATANKAIPSDVNGREQGHSGLGRSVSRYLRMGTSCITIVAIPATAALWLLATPILYTLFQYQAMTPVDVGMATVSLQAYSLEWLLWQLKY